MTRTTKREYIKITQERYFKSNRKQKTTILNELSQTLAIHRKSAIRLLNNPPEPKKATRAPRPFLYSKHVIWIVEELWRMTEYPCGTILKACIPLWLPFLKKYYTIDSLTEKHLLEISASTIDRRLKQKRLKLKSKIYGKTWPHPPRSNPHQNFFPQYRLPWISRTRPCLSQRLLSRRRICLHAQFRRYLLSMG